MPTYDYKCRSEACAHTFEAFNRIVDRHEQLCPKCFSTAMLQISGQSAYIPFPDGLWEHLDIDPVHVKDRKDLRDKCRRLGCTSIYLEDSGGSGGFSEI